MDSIRKIEQTVLEKQKQGYEGYIDILEYFEKISEEQLDYIEVTERTHVATYERFRDFKHFMVLLVSMFALLYGAMPDILKNDISNFLKTGPMLLMGIISIILGYVAIEQLCSRNINRKVSVLEIVSKVKQKQQAQCEVKEKLNERTRGTIYVVKVEKR